MLAKSMSREKLAPLLMMLVGVTIAASLAAIVFLHHASNQRIYYRVSLLPSQQWKFGRSHEFMSYPLEQRVSPDEESYGVLKIVHYRPYNLGFVRIIAQTDEYPGSN